MAVIKPIRIPISQCNGAMLRWYYNGWHHYTFNNRYQLIDTPTTYDTQVTEEFSAISRVEIPTGKSIKQSIEFGEQGIKSETFEGIKGLMLAEVAEIYIEGFWFKLEVERTSYKVRTNDQNAYDVVFKSEIKDGAEFLNTILTTQEDEPITPTYILFEEFDNWDAGVPVNWTLTASLDASISQEEIFGDNYIVFTMADLTSNSITIKRDLSPFFGTINIYSKTLRYAGVTTWLLRLHKKAGGFIDLNLMQIVQEGVYESIFTSQLTISQSDEIDYVLISITGVASELAEAEAKMSNIIIEKL